MSAYLAVPVYTPLFSNNPLFSWWHYLLLNFILFFLICRGTCDSWLGYIVSVILSKHKIAMYWKRRCVFAMFMADFIVVFKFACRRT